MIALAFAIGLGVYWQRLENNMRVVWHDRERVETVDASIAVVKAIGELLSDRFILQPGGTVRSANQYRFKFREPFPLEFPFHCAK